MIGNAFQHPGPAASADSLVTTGGDGHSGGFHQRSMIESRRHFDRDSRALAHHLEVIKRRGYLSLGGGFPRSAPRAGSPGRWAGVPRPRGAPRVRAVDQRSRRRAVAAAKASSAVPFSSCGHTVARSGLSLRWARRRTRSSRSGSPAVDDVQSAPARSAWPIIVMIGVMAIPRGDESGALAEIDEGEWLRGPRTRTHDPTCSCSSIYRQPPRLAGSSSTRIATSSDRACLPAASIDGPGVRR